MEEEVEEVVETIRWQHTIPEMVLEEAVPLQAMHLEVQEVLTVIQGVPHLFLWEEEEVHLAQAQGHLAQAQVHLV